MRRLATHDTAFRYLRLCVRSRTESILLGARQCLGHQFGRRLSELFHAWRCMLVSEQTLFKPHSKPADQPTQTATPKSCSAVTKSEQIAAAQTCDRHHILGTVSLHLLFLHSSLPLHVPPLHHCCMTHVTPQLYVMYHTKITCDIVSRDTNSPHINTQNPQGPVAAVQVQSRASITPPAAKRVRLLAQQRLSRWL